MTIKKLLPLALAAALGCMHGRGQGQGVARVSDADAGRLGPEQMGPVNGARQDLDAARDALARASLGLEQARNEEGTAKAEQQAAEAAQKVADAQQKVASDSRAPEAVEKARLLRAHATAQEQAAKLHAEYAEKLVAERAAEVKAAERRVGVAEARVEWAKLRALDQAGIPAATKYDPRLFQEKVNEAQQAFDEASQDARALEAEATAVRRRWDEVQRRVPAQGDGDRSGTGSGK